MHQIFTNFNKMDEPLLARYSTGLTNSSWHLYCLPNEGKRNEKEPKINEPASGFICMILEEFRSTFRIKRGKTSTWSVETTSHPSNAMPI